MNNSDSAEFGRVTIHKYAHDYLIIYYHVGVFHGDIMVITFVLSFNLEYSNL